ALAWAGLADAWLLLDEWQIARPGDARQEATAAAEKAMLLDPQLAEAHDVWGRVKLFFQHDWSAADRELKKAIELDPTHTEHRCHYAGLVLALTGRFKESEEQAQVAISLDPGRPLGYNEMANTLIKSGQFEAAVPYLAASRRTTPSAPGAIVRQG